MACLLFAALTSIIPCSSSPICNTIYNGKTNKYYLNNMVWNKTNCKHSTTISQLSQSLYIFASQGLQGEGRP
jgi:hypothetical protein